MIQPKYPIASIALLFAFASASTLAGSLKDKPPEGVKLAGTEWQLDPYHSDDANAVIDRASRKVSTTPRAGGGVFGDDEDDPMSRRNRGDTTTGGRFPSEPRTSTRWPDSGRNPIDIDPTGAGGGVTMQFGTQRGSLFFESLRTNPEKVSFSEGNQSVTVTEDGLNTECEAGKKEPFSDSYGDGERSCGWNGRAFVVETKRGRQFNRTDRYELSKDGRTLRYTTTASEEGMGRVTIDRKYQIPVPKR